jgi:uncharacterized protein
MTDVQHGSAVPESDQATFTVDVGDHVVVFTADTMEFVVSPRSRLAGDSTSTANSAYRSDPDPLKTATHLLSRQRASRVIESHADTDSRPALDRLTLTVSNACNLSCTYCYADQGTYYNKPGLLMESDVAFAALNRALRAYSRIEHINFFGGEPTLNYHVIDLACGYLQYLYNKGDIDYLPSFGVTTSGYAIPEAMFAVIQRHHLSVTLSMDGPPDIHNLKRPTKSGKPSYDSVATVAKRLMSLGIEIEFECTYTADHLAAGYSIIDLMDFFAAEFECRVLHCQIVSAAPSSGEYVALTDGLRLEGDAIEASLRNLAEGIPKATSLAVRMLNSLRLAQPIWNYCPAGTKEVTVNADGKVYACFMLMQSPSFSFGDVGVAESRERAGRRRIPLKIGIVESNGAPAVNIEQFIKDSNKQTHSECQRCWARPLCHGCMGADYERFGGIVSRSSTPGVSEFCDYKRGLVERFFRCLAEVAIAEGRASNGASLLT